jgi:hypothetical protein
MYEGDYEGTRFCLLLAYDRYAEKRTIFFDPVSINEYFPDKDYRTLYIEGSNDSQSQPLEIENQCTKSIDEVKEEASQFLEEKLAAALIGKHEAIFGQVGLIGVVPGHLA